MPRISLQAAGGLNVCAFLDTLAVSEIGEKMLALSDDGYDVLVGSLPNAMHVFSGYGDHPLPRGHALEYRDGLWSTAAGRYQILSRYWPHYRDQLDLPDFGPESQDRYAIQQIKEQRALDPIKVGEFVEAVDRCRNIWASLPGAGYGQHENTLERLAKAYTTAGGQMAGDSLHWWDEVEKNLS
ncbi:glycoside hydrolase family 24 protein [Halomonas sp. V046]|uniref:glycoside hydrolase family 24 protein n=1 Tax=Halomonas sp. V046 TaxID=3459611 RepID=UPI004043B272